MDKILEYLLKNLSFIYNQYEFKFVDSMTSSSFGGDGYLTLRSDYIEIRITNDRDQLFLDFRSTEFDKDNEWHSVDLIKQLITGIIDDTSMLNDDIAASVKENFSRIRKLFDLEKAKDTVMQLRKLEAERAKRLFK